MKLLVETLKEKTNGFGKQYYQVDYNLSEEMPNETAAIARANVLKNQSPNHKIRSIEYRNDEPDITRTACKVLYVA